MCRDHLIISDFMIGKIGNNETWFKTTGHGP